MKKLDIIDTINSKIASYIQETGRDPKYLVISDLTYGKLMKEVANTTGWSYQCLEKFQGLRICILLSQSDELYLEVTS